MIKTDKERVKNSCEFIKFADGVEGMFQAYRGHDWPSHIADKAAPIVADILGISSGTYARNIAIGVLCDLKLN